MRTGDFVQYDGCDFCDCGIACPKSVGLKLGNNYKISSVFIKIEAIRVVSITNTWKFIPKTYLTLENVTEPLQSDCFIELIKHNPFSLGEIDD